MEQAEVTWPDGLSATSLPTYLALPMLEYLREPNARVRLHWMLDTMEVAIRWACAVLLAEVRAANGGTLPTMIRRSIQEHIERPTVGRWVGMLRILSTGAPDSPLCPASAFALHDDVVAPLFSSDGDESQSMLVLRNRVAHGGGLSTRLAGELLAAHQDRFANLIRAIADCTGDLDIQAVGDDGVLSLRGLTPGPAASPHLIDDAGEQVWVTDGSRAISLSPLVAFGPIRILNKDGLFVEHGAGRAPQIYARASAQSLSYTPLGRDEAHAERAEVDAFRELFGLNEARSPKRAGKRDFSHTDFLKEAADQAESLVGRVSEIKEIKKWIKKCPSRDAAAPRIAWLRAGPGLGKSMVMARIARDLGNSSHHGLYFHHFQTGDVRNNRRMFLQLLQEALWSWEPLKARTAPPASGNDIEDLLEDVQARLGALAGLKPKNPRAPAASFRVLLDGLDAAVQQDPGMPELIRQLALPGSVWILAGRPDHGLGAALRGDDVAPLFGDAGLPPMGPADLRALLLEGLGNARYALLKRDEDQGEEDQPVRNAFVEGVVERAGGLPLYVELLLEDLRSGHITVDDEDRLPDGLNTYYAELMGRMGISDVQVNLTLLVCLLARAEEALDPMSIRYLLSPSLDIGEDTLEPEEAAHTAAVLRAGRTLLRESVAASGERAFVLYHKGFREYINGTDALRRTRRRAEALLVQMSDRWTELPESNLRNHLFRWGTEYALWWGGRRGLSAARRRLMDFDYLMARTHALPAFENLDLAQEYVAVREKLPEDEVFAGWADFIGSRDHLLQRGTDRWPSDRILLQQAIEYADSSPVTQSAEAWLGRCGTPWLWLRHTRRPAHVAISACQAVFEGHGSKIDGVLLRDDSTALSYSKDNTLRLWDLDAKICLRTFSAHSKRINGVHLLPGDRAVSFAQDGLIIVWDLNTGEEVHRIDVDAGKVIEGMVMLDDGRFISCSRNRDKTVKLWDLASGKQLGAFKGHKRYVRRLQPLPGGRFLSVDRSIRLWDPATGDKPVHTLTGHKADVLGVIPFGEQKLLSYSKDKTLCIWDLSSGACLHTLSGHTADVTGAMIVDDEQIISWSKDGSVRVWSTDGEAVGALCESGPAVMGAKMLGERLLSWDSEGTLTLWDMLTLTPVYTIDKHDGTVLDAVQLRDGRLLSLSSRGPIEVWDGETGARLARVKGHITSVEGLTELPDGQLFSWSGDGTLRLWSSDPALFSEIARIDAANFDPDEHEGFVGWTRTLPGSRMISWAADKTLRVWGPDGVQVLSGHSDAIEGARWCGQERVLSWAKDFAFRIWSLETGACLHTLEGHKKLIRGVRFLSGDRMLSWSSDATLRVWDLSTGACLHTLAGHSKLIKGIVLLDDDQKVLSYASDAELRLWSLADGQELAVFSGHTKLVEGASVLPDGRILSWAGAHDGTLRLWSQAGELLATMEGHDPKKAIKGATVLSDGRILSWSADGTLRLWSDKGVPQAELPGHTDVVSFAAELEDGRIISAVAKGGEYRRWAADGSPLGVISAEMAPLEWTADWMAWKAARHSAWSCGVGVIDDTTSGVRLLINDEDGPVVIPWHGPRGRWSADLVRSSGEIVGRDTSSLYFLRLYYGARPVDLDEAQEIIT